MKPVSAIFLSALALSGGISGNLSAQTAVRVESAAAQVSGEVQLPLNKSRVIRVDRPVTDVLVGNPQVADVMALSDRSIYVLGKSLGSTNIVLYGANRSLISLMDVTVTPDLPTLRQRLHELMPNERVEVRGANDAVVLSGTVSNGELMKRAVAVAENFAPGKVTNMLGMAGGQQVMLAVRFAEVKRNLAKQLGLNTNILVGRGNDQLAFRSGSVPNLTPFAAAAGMLNWGSVSIDLLLDALEQKGIVKTLAEPNLIAMSGETASFLAGGEFPIPVGTNYQNGTNFITIEFKQFGVKLAFTPTVLGNGTINLLVEPEVSAIDKTNAVVLQGTVVPGLTTRRARTTVDLRHGESFAIAGLIQSNFTDGVNQMPGLGDIPVLGALLRSSSFQQQETELVIIVTPYLVRPTLAGQLRLPTDNVAPPQAMDLFLKGRIEGARPGPAAAAPAAAMPAGAGLAGDVGYVLR
ncbi:type II and III secretion system protein family protein [Azospirillum canadense]|uniref:type II and III secretion system protein family protein n=1 Tax=Azospirillum canadense TaxID=403962 RepID=UPI002225EEB1|nr:type II and III secretion system protein family protein [Azospirillum canadense]MCW2238702.1 pilus assembly protein CpaC [Azospirillum canadense]